MIYQQDYSSRPAANTGPKPGLCDCKVVKVHNSDPASGYPLNVNFASAFSYDVDAQTPSGPPVRFRRGFGMDVRPNNEDRWPSPWMVQAFRVGQRIPGTMIDGKMTLTKAEERWAAPCGWTPGPSNPPPSGDMPAPPPLRAPPLPGIIPTTPPYPGAIP